MKLSIFALVLGISGIVMGPVRAQFDASKRPEEAQAFGSDQPKALPVQILDFASGFLMAFGTQAALLKRAREGGSWHVEVSLLGTANWLRRMGRTDPAAATRTSVTSHLQAYPCANGTLLAMPHGAKFSTTPATWQQPSAPPGSHMPEW